MLSTQKWNLSRSSRNFRNFLYSLEGHILFEELEEIRLTIDKKVKAGVPVTAGQGLRKSQKGTDFSPGTLKSIRMARRQCELFQVKSGKNYDFYDIDYGFRTMFLSYLYGDKKYNVNTAAKCINTLVTILSSAEAEGYHTNVKCLSRQFRAKRKDVDNIYMTKDELSAIMDADISHMSKLHEMIRDIFMVGVYTAQRVSDYNNIG